MKLQEHFINLRIKKSTLRQAQSWVKRNVLLLVLMTLSLVSVYCFYYYYQNGLGVAYNDARSHLDIGRRVVEGLKPGIAQLGSVWLPLNHVLMIPTIWNNWMWHSGLSGAIQSMISFVATGALVFLFLKELKVGILGRLFGVLVFAANLNILYLQSTAMTELLLLGTMTAGCYYLLLWAKKDTLVDLIKAAFWIMMSTMVRYDGWFLLLFSTGLVALTVFLKKGYKTTEGIIILFLTLGGFGIALWFLWNLLIFKDPLYFIFGPYSAHTQQEQLLAAGNLDTKGNLLLSIKVYIYALIYNSYAYTAFISAIGAAILWFNKRVNWEIRLISVSLIAPLIFNILALVLGFSVLFIQGIAGNTWFNVRYGIMLAPSIAIFSGYLIDKLKDLRWLIIGLFLFVTFFAFVKGDAVTIDDARVGSSQKNVTEVSTWLRINTANKPGFILISAASHDAIIFSSDLPMGKFIHEGTGAYWDNAIANPDLWARWIVLRTHDNNDLTYRLIQNNIGFTHYNLVDSYPFADIYELKSQYLKYLHTTKVFKNQK